MKKKKGITLSILELNPQIFSKSISATDIWKFDSTI